MPDEMPKSHPTSQPSGSSSRSLEGKVALISGGGSGIGQATAEALANAGAAVAITGRRHRPLAETVDALRGAGAQALAITGDVARATEAEHMVRETIATFGALHILVNNAGIATAGPLADMDAATVDALIDIDLKGPIYLTRAALGPLSAHRAQGGASIVNVSSSVTQHPLPGYSVYSAAKAGLDMLTRCWARELAADRIRVNAVCPGVVRTPIHDGRGDPAEVAAFLAAVGDQTPLGRVGEVGEIANLIRFLVTPGSAWMTGAVIPLDGGLSLT
jgi:NAD(P)-dependent dehydrogenase (short-subunit alcohol dehydrogenase family)